MTGTLTPDQTSEALQGGCCPAAPALPACRQPIPQEAWRTLCRHFTTRRATYIANVLTPGELAVITDAADALIIARIKRMDDVQLAHFERLEPATPDDRRLYAEMQCRWLRDEEYLLSTRLGRTPTHGELFADFMRNHNGLRFRAYFALKFPGRVKRTRCKQAS